MLTNSDPNLHLLGENPSIDWAGEFGDKQEVDGVHKGEEGDTVVQKRRRMKQVVSMVQVDGTSTVLPNESCMEVPSVQNIPEEQGEGDCIAQSSSGSEKAVPVKEEVSGLLSKGTAPDLPNGTASNFDKQETTPKSSQDSESKLAIESAIQQIEDAVQGEDGEQSPVGISPVKSEETFSAKEEALQKENHLAPTAEQEDKITPSIEEPAKVQETITKPKQEKQTDAAENSSDSHSEPQQHLTDTDSGFQSPGNETVGKDELQAATSLAEAGQEKHNDSEKAGEDAGKGADTLTTQT